MGLLIGDVAQRAGISAPTIRYYEEIGLLPAPPRSSTGYRRYCETTVEELKFIRSAQALGFSLAEIGQILKLNRAGRTPCEQVLSMAHRHLGEVEERIRQLQRFHALLAAELAKWDGKTTPTCRGLCQIITSANADGAVEPADSTSRLGRTRTRRLLR
jgi:MerR family mercuric resistance operon transcriptional regulator